MDTQLALTRAREHFASLQPSMAMAVAEWGYRDQDGWAFFVGPVAWVRDGLEAAEPMDPPLLLVSTYGDVELTSYLMHHTRIDAMEPVGHRPTEPAPKDDVLRVIGEV